MAPSKERQRKLARAKLDRQMARRAAKERRRRRVGAATAIGIVAVLGAGLAVWALGVFDRDEDTTEASGESCSWTTQAGADATRDVGQPSTENIPSEGTRPATLTFNSLAPVTATLNITDAPCSVASFSYLAGRQYFDNTKCTEITEEGALHCGDITGDGLGGPTYTYFDENIPVATNPSAPPSGSVTPAYPAGTIALTSPTPGQNGSQFLIFFKDFNPATPKYPIIGSVATGLETVQEIGKTETVANDAGEKVVPKSDVLITSLTVGEVGATAAPAAPAASASTAS
ncbi:peptidyl-prolyl cis-trans isomerase B (cyclophilin B) [Catenuloplanes nepalensis]|uniref:Peptidyl-prolyl cis-trans isomerase B (Cyclophilin B) n=1 Tax=Catenuloplanes nepalensis TaxID=587533 RepID=A0ABT9MY11_9ACTN|nr:peptidylprolyl isomerase [Catenuloplanes nepalensis]MDP9796279.1 peptidyl-prolyl cis-trans isomerase B (cyclophilin B) [Catenuloplanes nepalensis]